MVRQQAFSSPDMGGVDIIGQKTAAYRLNR